MKLTVLGSSHGVPEKNRKCSCILVEVAENRYFLDMGMDAMGALRDKEIPVESVKGIFISHLHGDHANGLFAFVDLISWYFRDADPEICLPHDDGISAIKSWCSLVDNRRPIRANIRFSVIHSGVFFDDGTLRVTAFATQHCQDSFAFLLEAEGKRVLYTGDLNSSMKDFPQAAVDAGLDLFICEGAHFSPMQYVPLLQGRSISQIVWTHHFSNQEPYFEGFCAAMAPIPVQSSFDGMEIFL